MKCLLIILVNFIQYNNINDSIIHTYNCTTVL